MSEEIKFAIQHIFSVMIYIIPTIKYELTASKDVLSETFALASLTLEVTSRAVNMRSVCIEQYHSTGSKPARRVS